jgi:hypothetical protein
MFHRFAAAALLRWHDLKSDAKSVTRRDRGDSPVPTVIIWIGLAAIAATLVVWAANYLTTIENQAPGDVTP